jgi:hypothetical protein
MEHYWKFNGISTREISDRWYTYFECKNHIATNLKFRNEHQQQQQQQQQHQQQPVL